MEQTTGLSSAQKHLSDKRPRKIFLNISDILKANREPYQTIIDPERCSFIRLETLVGGSRRMGDQTFCITEIV